MSITIQPYCVTETTIAVTQPVKDRIKKLQHELALEHNENMNQGDVIEYLLDNMEDHRND